MSIPTPEPSALALRIAENVEILILSDAPTLTRDSLARIIDTELMEREKGLRELVKKWTYDGPAIIDYDGGLKDAGNHCAQQLQTLLDKEKI